MRGDEILEAVAWLHEHWISSQGPTSVSANLANNVVEDTSVTLDDLRAEGFPEQVVEAVGAITKHHEEDPVSYYARVRSNALALRVKAADIADNSDPSRLALLDDATRQRLTQKYANARMQLGLADEEHSGHS